MDATGAAFRIFHSASCYLTVSLLPCLKWYGEYSSTSSCKCCGEGRIMVLLFSATCSAGYRTRVLKYTLMECSILSKEFLTEFLLWGSVVESSVYTDA